MVYRIICNRQNLQGRMYVCMYACMCVCLYMHAFMQLHEWDHTLVRLHVFKHAVYALTTASSSFSKQKQKHHGMERPCLIR
jgi:hypothetical protein